MQLPLSYRFYGLVAALGISAAVIPGAANAGTATGVTNVSASIAQKCIMTTPATLSFGAYDPIGTNASANLAASTTITYQCTKGADTYGSPKPWLDLDAGANSGQVTVSCVGAGTTTCTRTMKEANNGTDYLSYDLYTSAAYTTVWNTANTASYTRTSMAATNLTVYGLIAAGQNVTVSTSYPDSVTATVIGRRLFRYGGDNALLLGPIAIENGRPRRPLALHA
jgi:spore coat protein U domain-containing protein, fimbrial subunit CupE1/2/3/6